jgi:hypothetical protein
MARKPSEPSPKSTGSKTVDDDRSAEQLAAAGGRPQIAAGEIHPANEHAAPSETAGPIALTRLRKADGRALILYSAAGDRA